MRELTVNEMVSINGGTFLFMSGMGSLFGIMTRTVFYPMAMAFGSLRNGMELGYNISSLMPSGILNRLLGLTNLFHKK